MFKNWGPYLMVPSPLNKNISGKVILLESLNCDLLREELISSGLAPDLVRVSNPWYYRKTSDSKWLLIGESCDIENNFYVEWDISTLENGTYELMGSMRAFTEEDCLEKMVTRSQNIVKVLVKN